MSRMFPKRTVFPKMSRGKPFLRGYRRGTMSLPKARRRNML